jgi:hypothetical protein
MGRESIEGLSRGVRGEMLTCSGHPHMFFDLIISKIQL